MSSRIRKLTTRRGRLLITFGSALAVLALFAVATRAYSTSSYKWAVSPVLVYANPTNKDVTASAAEAAIQSALNTWSTQSGSYFRYQYGGRVADTTSVFDGRNVVILRDATNGGAIGSTYTWWSGGVRVDSDVILWDAAWRFFTGTSGCSDGVYIEDVATHELGHMLGLQHSSVTDATMYSTYNRCSTAMRTLASDDLSGLKKLYPSSTSSTSSTNSAPTVTITAPVTGTSIIQGTPITFSGSATDTQDGNLTSSLVWTSSRDGQIGTGTGFSRTLSAGSHTISARVVDSGGLAASRQVGVTVNTTTSTTTSTSSSGNMALASKGGVARASSVYSSGYGPGSVINGDRKGTGWGSGGGWKDATQDAYPDWIEVQFTGTPTINRVDVFSLQDAYKTPVEPTPTMTFTKYGVTSFRLEYWTGSTWAPISGGSVSGNNRVWRSVTFSPVTTSRIRVVVIAALDHWSRVTEVEAHSGTTTTGGWNVCASEGGFCAFSGTQQVRYGANGSYFYKTLTGGTACTNSVFGDPVLGTVKQCSIGGSSSTSTTTWSVCASEGGLCAFSGTQQVRYGANGSYFYRTLTGGTACTNSVFGDPAPGTPKQCSIGGTAPTTTVMNNGPTNFEVEYWTGSAWPSISGASVTGSNLVRVRLHFRPSPHRRFA